MWAGPQVTRSSTSKTVVNDKFSSHQAAAFYMQNRYAEYPDCPKSCTRMDVDAKFKIKTRSSTAKIGILLQRELMVIEEYYARSLISTGEVSITDHSTDYDFSCRGGRLSGDAARRVSPGSPASRPSYFFELLSIEEKIIEIVCDISRIYLVTIYTKELKSIRDLTCF